jgi:crotonobetainyl-CoA:carnitine CoA-transferase CaiB-like acyl-CoA transferase
VLSLNDSAHWVDVLGAAGIACAPVQPLSKALADDQTTALEMVGTLEHPTAGPVPIVRLPLRLSGAQTTAAEAPPLLGAGGERGFEERS